MQQSLKKYEPTDKGKELIAVLFPLAHPDREKSIQDYWKNYPKEVGAILDGFHFIIQELIEARNIGENTHSFGLSDELSQVIFKGMRDAKNFFSYSSLVDFISTVESVKPPIFANPKKINSILEKILATRPKHKSKFNLPVKLDDSIKDKLDKICSEAEVAYASIKKALPAMRNARKAVEDLKSKTGEYAEMDFKLAKATFQESYANYETNANKIVEYWPYIYDAYAMYPEEPLMVQVYIKYLAKLLASRESRYPVENYVLNLAEGNFASETTNFEPSEAQLQRGISSLTLKRNFVQQAMRHIHALESRYRKRKLMVKLKENTPKTAVIKELMEISHLDPIDIKTNILLARLFSEYARTLKDHQKRTSMREQALKCCNLANSRIEDYLDVQNIKEMKERDQIRAGFVKTINGIRLPLIKRG